MTYSTIFEPVPSVAPLAGARIAVCGTSAATPAEDALADDVGRLCAEQGAVVLCGGLGGVMTAVARGVQAAGGTSLGLLPGDDAAVANPFLTHALPTGLGEMRNALLARMSEAMIVVGGGYGTLSEIGFMLRLGRPVAALSTWSIVPPGGSSLEPAIHWAADATDAVEWVREALGR